MSEVKENDEVVNGVIKNAKDYGVLTDKGLEFWSRDRYIKEFGKEPDESSGFEYDEEEEEEIKSSAFPEVVYYIVVNGSKQYTTDRKQAEDMVNRLKRDSRVHGPYEETDPEEIEELYEAGLIRNSNLRSRRFRK